MIYYNSYSNFKEVYVFWIRRSVKGVFFLFLPIFQYQNKKMTCCQPKTLSQEKLIVGSASTFKLVLTRTPSIVRDNKSLNLVWFK